MYTDVTVPPPTPRMFLEYVRLWRLIHFACQGDAITCRRCVFSYQVTINTIYFQSNHRSICPSCWSAHFACQPDGRHGLSAHVCFTDQQLLVCCSLEKSMISFRFPPSMWHLKGLSIKFYRKCCVRFKHFNFLNSEHCWAAAQMKTT